MDRGARRELSHMGRGSYRGALTEQFTPWKCSIFILVKKASETLDVLMLGSTV